MSAPFLGKEFTFTQPDGSQIRLRGFGNPLQARFETLEGVPVLKDDVTGYYRPVTASDRARALEIAGARAAEARPEQARLKMRWEERREEKKRASKAALELGDAVTAEVRQGITGVYRGLCLLIEFPDFPRTIPQDEVEAFCNRPGYNGFGNNGSVFDYFFDNSGGKLQYTNLVAPYYQTRHRRAHYTDPSIPWPDRTRELIREALDHHKARGFDFTGLTTDDQGFVQALNVFYARERVNNFKEGLWPHASRLIDSYELGPGMNVRDYQITDMGTQLTLGTFCHENGHLICDFPDLYDTDDAEDPDDPRPESYGTGYYCLMGYGGDADPFNPVQVSAYLKYRAGWNQGEPRRIAPGQSVSLEAGRNDFALYEKNDTEYFILENRQKAGRDLALPDSGLAIWHVDEEKDSNNEEQRTPDLHYECSLEQADGRFELEKKEDAGDEEDLFPFGRNNQFGDATRPDSKWWDGTSSGLEIRRIRRAGATITFVSK